MPQSWWLKVKRAQKHMVEIRHAVRAYSEGHPYTLVRVRQPKRDRNLWQYKLVFTDQPDAMIAVMLGDFVHNLRSALDHIAVASSVPKFRKNASFPIGFKNLWTTDSQGNFVVPDDEGRKSFALAIRGLTEEAQAVVLGAQPYYHGENVGDHLLGILSRLENADKHRRLIAVGNVLQAPLLHLKVAGAPDLGPRQSSRQHFFHENTVVIYFTSIDPNLKESQVEVQCCGTAIVSIQIRGLGGNDPPSDYALYSTMLDLLRYTRILLRKMEPFVR